MRREVLCLQLLAQSQISREIFQHKLGRGFEDKGNQHSVTSEAWSRSRADISKTTVQLPSRWTASTRSLMLHSRIADASSALCHTAKLQYKSSTVTCMHFRRDDSVSPSLRIWLDSADSSSVLLTYQHLPSHVHFVLHLIKNLNCHPVLGTSRPSVHWKVKSGSCFCLSFPTRYMAIDDCAFTARHNKTHESLFC